MIIEGKRFTVSSRIRLTLSYWILSSFVLRQKKIEYLLAYMDVEASAHIINDTVCFDKMKIAWLDVLWTYINAV